jgi:hypothetical protein
MTPIEPGSPFPVNISLFAGEQSELLVRIAITESVSLCALIKADSVFPTSKRRSGRQQCCR